MVAGVYIFSGSGRITNDAETLKTRPLDKYFRVESLPKNPRYKTVGKTLEYVVQLSELADQDRDWLNRIAAVYEGCEFRGVTKRYGN